MIGRDLHNTLDFRRAVSPITGTDDTAFVSQIIDMSSLLGLTFVIMLGTLADAAFTSTVLLEEGDASNLSDAAAVSDDDMLPLGTGQEAAAAFIQTDDDAIKKISYVGTKRYVRLTITPDSNTGSLPIAVLAVGLPRIRGEATGA